MRALVVAALVAAAGAARADRVEGGEHWRLDAGKRGAVHVWAAPGLRAQSGVVVYVHGFYTDVDQSWSRHKLARQFRASKRTALFIVPEAPVGPDDEVSWPRVGDLLRFVADGTARPLPTGPLVAVGHSAAYRTIAGWLEYGPLDHVILLDALYGSEESYHDWLAHLPGHGAHRLWVVASDALRHSRPLVRRHAARTIDRLPAKLSPAERLARVLYLEPGVGHMNVVTDGKLIPLLLAP